MGLVIVWLWRDSSDRTLMGDHLRGTDPIAVMGLDDEMPEDREYETPRPRDIGIILKVEPSTTQRARKVSLHAIEELL